MSNEKVIEIEDIETWEMIVEKSSDLILVMFYSPSCPHCLLMEPYFNSYAKEFEGRVKFVKVNVIENIIIASKYGVLGTPTFKLFCKGHPIQDYVGEMYPSLIKKMVEDGILESEQCVDKVSWIYPNITSR